MKTSLVLVLCLAGLSVQQNLFWPFPPQARFQYLSQVMNRRADSRQQDPFADKIQDREGKLDVPSYFYAGNGPQFRTNEGVHYSPNAVNPFYRYYNYESQNFNPMQEVDQEGRVTPLANAEGLSGLENEPAARFFLPWRLVFGIRATSTVYSFVSTAFVVTSIRYCTEAEAFNSTNSCRRRRRDSLARLLHDLDGDAAVQEEPIEASAVHPVEATASPRMVDDLSQQPDLTGPVDISGSMKDVDQSNNRKARFIQTVTSTVTTVGSSSSTTIVTSTIRSSAILQSGSKLQCLPAGGFIC